MFEKFKTRSQELERLDTGDYTPEEYARWQREMPWIHGFMGEHRALKNSLLKNIRYRGAKPASILDVGAGDGALLKRIALTLNGRSGALVAADVDAEAASSVRRNGLLAVRCDALQLPFADNAFDYAFCSLFMHHLDDGGAEVLLREMARVAEGSIFVVDLNRDRLAYYAYKAVSSILLQRLTREDGALSILRSRTTAELIHLAQKAGLRDIAVQRSRLNRLVLSGRSAL